MYMYNMYVHVCRSTPEGGAGGVVDVAGGTCSSGLGSSPTPSPTHSLDPRRYRHGSNTDKLVLTLDGVALSLCGGLNHGNISEGTYCIIYTVCYYASLIRIAWTKNVS